MSGCIREEDNNGGNYSYWIGSHRLSSGINGRFAQWFSLHTHSTTAKVKINQNKEVIVNGLWQKKDKEVERVYRKVYVIINGEKVYIDP